MFILWDIISNTSLCQSNDDSQRFIFIFSPQSFRKCVPWQFGPPSFWRIRAVRWLLAYGIPIRSQDNRGTPATSPKNAPTWTSQHARNWGRCGGSRNDRAEPLRLPQDTRFTLTRSPTICGGRTPNAPRLSSTIEVRPFRTWKTIE